MTVDRPLRLGTRGSQLARWQADWVAARLTEAGIPVEIVPITTGGDVRRGSLADAGSTGLFTKEIQHALLDDRIDIAVHSLKDLPTETVADLTLAAVPPRAACGDVLVSHHANCIADLPEASRVGTGSLRRRAQLLYLRPDFQVADIRGNVETRLAKLDDGQYDAIVLAEAGLTRLGLQGRIRGRIPAGEMLPAVGQGALGIECRRDDTTAQAAVAILDDPESHAAVLAERSLLAELRGGCLAPVGAWGRIEDGTLRLDAVVLSADGRSRIMASGSGSPKDAETIGREIAQDLCRQGADRLLESCRRGPSDSPGP